MTTIVSKKFSYQHSQLSPTFTCHLTTYVNNRDVDTDGLMCHVDLFPVLGNTIGSMGNSKLQELIKLEAP